MDYEEASDQVNTDGQVESSENIESVNSLSEYRHSEEDGVSSPRLPRLPSAHLSRSVVEGTREVSNEEYSDLQDEQHEVPDTSFLITELQDTDSVKEDEDGNEEDAQCINNIETLEENPGEQSVNVTVETDKDNDDMWDTDLENDDDGDGHDPTGRVQYRTLCEELGVVPISYFVRHITQPEITMKYHGLGPASAKAIALVLRDNVTLEHLNLDGNWIGGDGGEAIARMLEENDYITEISLAGNQLGSHGAESICKMLQSNAGLRKINLADNNFTDADTDIFVMCLQNNKYLRELDMSKNRFGARAGELWGPAIGSNDTLDVLDLSWNHLRLKGGIAVARGLQENVRLKTFRIAWNGLGPECGTPFAEALATNSSLHELDLSGNRLDMMAAVAISKSLLVNDEIQTLRLGNNLISTAGAVALVTAINNNDSSSMKLLDITDVPVEFEFLRVVEDIRMKRSEFTVLHGPVLRSGNTVADIGKRAIDPYKRKEPVLVLKEHIVLNDMRLLDILKRYDIDNTFSVSPTDFIAALDELAVPYDKKALEVALKQMSHESGQIHFGDFYDQDNRPVSAKRAVNDGQIHQEQ